MGNQKVIVLSYNSARTNMLCEVAGISSPPDDCFAHPLHRYTIGKIIARYCGITKVDVLELVSFESAIKDISINPPALLLSDFRIKKEESHKDYGNCVIRLVNLLKSKGIIIPIIIVDILPIKMFSDSAWFESQKERLVHSGIDFFISFSGEAYKNEKIALRRKIQGIIKPKGLL